jgi:hypothetical protein
VVLIHQPCISIVYFHIDFTVSRNGLAAPGVVHIGTYVQLRIGRECAGIGRRSNITSEPQFP